MAKAKRSYLRVRDWKTHQHYGKRRPPWIKLHSETLEHEFWVDGDDAQRVLAIACMLIASKTDNLIPKNPRYVQRLAFLNQEPDFTPLIECGFLVETEDDTPEPPPGASDTLADCKQDASGGQAGCKQDATSETEAETKAEAETETNKKKIQEMAREVLAHLQRVTGRQFRQTADIEACIKRERCTVEDCKRVIDFKWDQWRGGEMAQYVNATTPWRKLKFRGYLDEAQAGPVGGQQESGQPVPRRSIEEAIMAGGGAE